MLSVKYPARCEKGILLGELSSGWGKGLKENFVGTDLCVNTQTTYYMILSSNQSVNLF